MKKYILFFILFFAFPLTSLAASHQLKASTNSGGSYNNPIIESITKNNTLYFNSTTLLLKVDVQIIIL